MSSHPSLSCKWCGNGIPEGEEEYMTTEGEFAEIVRYTICKNCNDELWAKIVEKSNNREFGW